MTAQILLPSEFLDYVNFCFHFGFAKFSNIVTPLNIVVPLLSALKHRLPSHAPLFLSRRRSAR